MSIRLFKGHQPLHELGNRIFAVAVAGANDVRGMSQGIPQQVFLSMVFEYTFFYLALTFEQGFGGMRAGRRKQVYEELVDLLIPAIVDFLFEENADHDKESMRKKFIGEAGVRLKNYREFASMVSYTGTCGIEDTALWNLSETIAKLNASGDNHHFIMACHSYVLDSLLVLDLERHAVALS